MTAFPFAGYAGQYLRVDLSTGSIEKAPLPLDWVEQYLGGNGIGTRILWDEVPPSTNPLDPGNKLIVATGPLCSSPIPNAGRMEFIAKSPLTGIYADSNSGGNFGPELKFAGYDLIIFEGQASEPVYLSIHDDTVELRSAGHVWGKGTFDTEALLQQEAHDPDLKVACIGQAGENLVRYAAIQVTYRRSAARSGMGAVMGSKNLKAIAVRGKGGVPMADPAAMQAVAFRLQKQIRENPFYPGVHRFGTPGLVSLMQPIGRFPTRNFRYGSFEGFEFISGETLREQHLVRDTACFGCPIGCDKVYKVMKGEFKGVKDSSVEYETLNALGSRVCVRNLPAVLKSNEQCDDYGLDTISAGSAIAFAMELAEKGILSDVEKDGLELDWGNYHTVIELLERITFRQGFLGDMLAICGAIAGAGYLLIGRKLRAKMSLIGYISMVYGMAAVVLIIIMLSAGLPAFGYSPQTYLWLILLAIIPQLFGHSTFNWALGYLSAAFVSITFVGEPIGSTILAYFILHEKPTLVKVVGGILILIGIYIASRSEAAASPELPD